MPIDPRIIEYLREHPGATAEDYFSQDSNLVGPTPGAGLAPTQAPPPMAPPPIAPPPVPPPPVAPPPAAPAQPPPPMPPPSYGLNPAVVERLAALKAQEERLNHPSYIRSLGASRVADQHEAIKQAQIAAYFKAANQMGSTQGKIAGTGGLDQVTGLAAKMALDRVAGVDKERLGLAANQALQDKLALGLGAKEDNFTKAKRANDLLDKRFMHDDQKQKELFKHQKELAKARKASGSGDAKTDAAFQKMGTAMNPGLAGARSDFGKQQALVSSADKIMVLGKQVQSQPGGGDKRQIHELAIASASLVGGSNAAQAIVLALVPHTYGSSAAGIEEWFSGNPTGTNQKAFVERMLETAVREKALATEKIKGYQANILASYSHLKDVDPERYASIQKMYLGDTALGPTGNIVPSEHTAPAHAPAAEAASKVPAPPKAPLPRKQYNAKLNKTRLIYPDGRVEEFDGIK